MIKPTSIPLPDNYDDIMPARMRDGYGKLEIDIRLGDRLFSNRIDLSHLGDMQPIPRQAALERAAADLVRGMSELMARHGR